ncbi:hypothetical protein NL532_24010 [Mesorhizobium sp. C120A]|uniref:hypothetical protein n=1 Tax=unclassified Mesorhizobium TaxID=325217 RepID=UPI0003CFB406|nr:MULTISPECIES: hypothetical protein [unclassified Mesorhizobium]ESZ60639.1 hypothetical protein X728_14965 [Mesorhizobium sp. L103C120A0]WJI43674.1 hypothetical protein NL532_24010 [Mesorhizobium sp. C120A]
MSGVVSSIGKVFSSVVKGVSTAIGSAVGGVGAIIGTAASAGSSLLGGGAGSLLSGLGGGGGILGSLLNGAMNVMTKGLGGLVDFGSQMAGGATALGGGMAAGASAAGGAAMAPSFLSKAGSFLTSETGAGLIGGIGKGLMEYEKMEQEAKERQKDRNYLLGKENRIRDSYNVDPASLPNGAGAGPGDGIQRPTPAQAYSRDFNFVYDPELGRIVKQGS